MRKDKKHNFIVRWLINAIAIAIITYLVGGILADDAVAILIAAFFFCFVNAFISPILVVLSLPLTLVTLGLFTIVINALMLLLTAAFIPGFTIVGFWSAFWGAILFSIFSSIISAIFD